MSDKTFYITIFSFLTVVFLIIGVVLYKDITITQPAHQLWFNQCMEKGGIPSKYEVIVGKTTHKEYLCIKPDAIIQ